MHLAGLMSMCVFMCVHACEYTKDWVCTSVYVCAWFCACMYVCVQVHVCACPCTRVCVYVYCKDEVLGCCSPFWLLTLPTDHGVLPHLWPDLAENLLLVWPSTRGRGRPASTTSARWTETPQRLQDASCLRRSRQEASKSSRAPGFLPASWQVPWDEEKKERSLQGLGPRLGGCSELFPTDWPWIPRAGVEAAQDA